MPPANRSKSVSGIHSLEAGCSGRFDVDAVRSRFVEGRVAKLGREAGGFEVIGWLSRLAGWASSNLELGRVQCAASGWNFGFYKIDQAWGELKVFVPLSRGRPQGLSAGDQARYRFDVKLFNENPKPTDLYDFVVQFTTGPRHNLTVLLEDQIEGQNANPTLVQLPSCQWVDTSITRDIKWTSSLDAADAVWLIARGPNDQHFRWLVAHLKKLKAQKDP